MLKPIIVASSLALAASIVPAAAQQRSPGVTPVPQAPAQREMGTTATLNLTAEEKHTVLQNVDKSAGNSTMGLGALTEGAAVPSAAKPQKFSDTVISKVPKLKTYSYFAADNKVAIVDPTGAKIAAVLDDTASK